METALESRKRNFIEKFLLIQDESKLKTLELILEDQRELMPFSIDELNDRARLALDDIKNNKTISTQKLKENITKWS